jgi:hypothetical protein
VIPTNTIKWFLFSELSYTLATGFVKLSVGVFLLRLVNKKIHKTIIYGTIGTVATITMAYTLFLLLQCSPVEFFWTRFLLHPGHCLAPETIGNVTYIHTAINAFSDWVFAILPVVITSQLQMNIRTKIVVSSILAMSAL